MIKIHDKHWQKIHVTNNNNKYWIMEKLRKIRCRKLFKPLTAIYHIIYYVCVYGVQYTKCERVTF